MDNVVREKWNDILDYMRDEYDISNVSFGAWLAPLKVYKCTDKQVIILIPDSKTDKADEKNVDFYKNYLNSKYKYLLSIAIEEKTGLKLEPVFMFSDELEEKTEEKKKDKEKEKDSLNITLIEEANLNPKYTFSSFVVGNSNKMAHAASIAVAESPGDQFKILYLYGGVGLGKTHLMHAVAHYVLKNDPKAKILYVTSETFINDYVESIQNKRGADFRRKYRNLDMLLIDDIQFIAGKESTQEEFFHTFNSLYERNKQIIITSDKPPKDINNREERIRSRFEGGRIVDIQPPDYETRMAILYKKEEMDHLNIDNEVLKYIAENITSNIRELEGALTRIVAKSRLEKMDIDINMARNILKDYIGNDQNQNAITPGLIISIVAEHFGISTADIISQKKNKELAYPRQIAMYLCCTMTQDSLQQIGKAVGDRDHSTVIHGRDKIAKEIKSNEKLASAINILKKKISP